ncbi:hypothetical protein UCRPA7_5406 [Phaeoacremonium minimum UCRPA7]|uniref:Roadblock/LAMTOR2 domain-containing protein n=1 Tax=Phaeoacremonium minimum (strain UCR-PA7) TaxID=1286976 RepID=R8BI74_PHAM7|nr:hypothetical protein UCRPA7_5406 [Phaeoacremonium minimum UCRPA7]EON99011.1 hypothetical protein UCRPA7_5406 [Phaeoacremonium minimum UCRPA7]
MSDQTTSNGADALEETLGRLLKKPGVKAAIALDRASGAILKTSGQISSIRTSKPQAAQGTGSFATDAATGQPSETQGAEELAAMVWTFVSTAGSLVQELDSEDELKLLRLRTKKQELVIVPDSKYLLIVIHDTPPA